MGSDWTTLAQNYVDLANLYYANTPLNAYDSTDDQTRIEELGMDVVLPFELKTQKVIISGLRFERLSTKVAPQSTDITSVYTVLAKAGLRMTYGEKWSATYVFLPKLSSDLLKIDADDFQFGGLAYFKYLKSSRLNYQFGIYYNSELYGPFFVAMLGLYYQSENQRFETNINLPLLADFNYKFSDGFRLGTQFNAFVNSYNINQPQYSEKGEYLVKTSNEIFLYAHFNVTKRIILQTKMGYTIGRRYAIYDEKDQVTFGFSAFYFNDDRQQLNSDFNDGLVFRINLIYRFDLSESP